MLRRRSRVTPLVNLALRLTTRRRDPDAAIDHLIRRNGINEATDTPFYADMRFLLRQVAAVDNLSPLGWTSFYSDIENRLRNRARVLRLLNQRPEILAEKITAPIIVVGLPRTATTLAHHILAGAEELRGPMLWEWMHTDLELPERERRQIIRGVDNAMRFVTAIAPAMRVIHPQGAQRPDECAFYLPHGEQHLARTPMPGYEKWITSRDFEPDYLYLKQGLQILQHGRPRSRWVLKCPTHLGHLTTLMKIFPGATIVWTHRDPITVVGSIGSLIETSWSIHLNHLGQDELHDIGRMTVSTMSSLVERGRDARTAIGARIGAGHIIDVPYPVLTANPVKVVHELYDLLGLNWTTRDAQRVEDAQRRGPGRSHEYTINRYGVDESKIHDAFGDYARLADLPGIRRT